MKFEIKDKTVSCFLFFAICYVLTIVGFGVVQAATKKNERYYQDIFCKKQNGVTEFVLEDKTRVDCLTKTHAIEVDFAKSNKAYEALGQAVHYSRLTSLQPGIVFIVTDPMQHKYVSRVMHDANSICLRVDIWTINAEGVIEHVTNYNEEGIW